MCRNIKKLANFEPPATPAEIQASALQFVRKVSGMGSPSKVNQEVFDNAVDEATETVRKLLASLVIQSVPVNRRDVG